MWFRSFGDGAARYDGYEFRVFRHERDNPESDSFVRFMHDPEDDVDGRRLCLAKRLGDQLPDAAVYAEAKVRTVYLDVSRVLVVNIDTGSPANHAI